MSPYIGDRQLDPDEDDESDITCPCGSGAYTTHGFCSNCNWQDDLDPPDPDFE